MEASDIANNIEYARLLIVIEEVSPTTISLSEIFDNVKTRLCGFDYRVCAEYRVKAADLNWADTLLFVRTKSPISFNIAKLARKKNKRIYCFFDDDFLSLADDYLGVGVWPGRKKALVKLLHISDGIISPNKLLAEKYGEIGGIKEVGTVDTVVDSDKMVKYREPAQKCRLLMYVNDGSLESFNIYILPALKLLGERMPDSVKLYLFTLKPDCGSVKNIEIEYVDHMPYAEFIEFLSNTDFDIGLAPLDNIGFNQYKYFNKFIEYTKIGAMGIYSDCPLYRLVVENGVNGALVDNTPESWVDAIEYYYKNHRLRINCINNAQELIRDRFNAESVIAKLVADMPKLFEKTASDKKIRGISMFFIKIKHYFSRLRERLYLLKRYYKAGGLRRVRAALDKRRAAKREGG